MRVLIDADSLIYVIAWNYREEGTEEEVKESCDQMLAEIMTMTRGTDYLGVFSPKFSFRQAAYRYAKYKAGRGEKPEWLIRWQDTIKSRFELKHGFFTIPELEADDVVAAAGQILTAKGEDRIICSPDKDLRQVPGLIYVPKKQVGDTIIEGNILNISEEDANYTFWMQMLTGDSTDNVAGVPGLGEVKAKKVLLECMDPMMYPSAVLGQYCKYFGSYYGKIIYDETYLTLKMMGPEHPLWENYREKLQEVTNSYQQELRTTPGFFDI